MLAKFLESIYLYLKSFVICSIHTVDEIPEGSYCYTIKKIVADNDLGFRIKTKSCPFHEISPIFPTQLNGYCHLLKRGDWMTKKGCGLLWDQCKECHLNDPDTLYELGNA